MQLTFLGTSAANAYPEAFCQCEHCCLARQIGGKNLRLRASALVNDDLLLDLGPDIHAAAQRHSISLLNVRYCLQTHPHADHLDLSQLLSRSPGFGVVGAPRLELYGSPQAWQRADQTFRRDLWGYGLLDPRAESELNFKVHTLQPFKPTQIGPYRVTALQANHAHGFGAYLYAIQKGDRAVFYGLDTASLLEQTWGAFQRFNFHFDLVVLDHTYGPNEPGSDHLCAREVAEHAARMREGGFLKPGGRVFASHIAHEGNPDHATLSKYARQHGYEVAHDGLVVDILDWYIYLQGA